VSQLTQIYPFLILPLLTGIVGSAGAAWRVPGARFHVLIQQGAAGLILAAVGGIILPLLVREQTLLPLLGGFGAGTALMLGIRAIVPRFERRQEEGALPITEVVTVAIAYWASGLLIGTGFATGPVGGALIALVVTGQILVLSVSMVTLLRSNEVSRGLAFAMTCALALMIGAGLAPGIAVSNLLVGAPLHLVLAFAAAALLTVVVESALAEASSSSSTTAATAAFAISFVILFVIELLLGSAA
jgi:zinc transporter ZupT